MVMEITFCTKSQEERKKRKQRTHKAAQAQTPHYNGLSFYSNAIINNWTRYMLRCIFINYTGFKKIKAKESEIMNLIYSIKHHTRICSDISALVETHPQLQ